MDPTHDDKKALMNIIKKMNKSEHLALYKKFLYKNELVTFTNDAAFFDLNDLDNNLFWEIYEDVKPTSSKLYPPKIYTDLREKRGGGGT